MFSNKVVFIIIISNNLRYIITNYILSKIQEFILASMKRINNTYSHRYFRITEYNADKNYEALQVGLTSIYIKLNMVSEDYHVP